MKQVYLFFVANKDIKDSKKIDPFRIKTSGGITVMFSCSENLWAFGVWQD
jgi:hypothetical protein